MKITKSTLRRIIKEELNRAMNEEEAITEQGDTPPWWAEVARTEFFKDREAAMKKGQLHAKNLRPSGFQDKIRQMFQDDLRPGEEPTGKYKELGQKFARLAKSKPVLAGLADAIATEGHYSKEKEVQRQALRAIAAILR
jgi:hypothetical protein